MEQGSTEETGTAAGQAADTGSAEQTTQTAPTNGDGQSAGLQGKTNQGTQAEDSFFDPTNLSPELMPAYKNMQKAFTKKMEAIKAGRQKIDAFDAFSKDPVGQIQAIAKQYGYSLTRAEAQQQLNQQQAQAWEPKTWDEVLERAEERAYARLRQEQEPILREVQNLRKTNLESFLDNNAPDWRQYEDEMMDNIRLHPSLVNDPIKLYRLSVPEEILQSRATQAAIKKMQDKASGTQVAGTSTTKHGAEAVPDKAMSFDEAVKFAQRKLAKEGLRPPA